MLVVAVLLGVLLAVLAIVGSSNAVNLTDGLDGLAIGSTVIVSLVFLMFTYIASHAELAAYLNVPVYADFHRWLGRSDDLDGMWSAWSDGDRKAALDAIPDHVVDELIVHGHPEECREHIDRYHEMGVTTSTVSIMPFGDIDPVQAARDLAPAER